MPLELCHNYQPRRSKPELHPTPAAESGAPRDATKITAPRSAMPPAKQLAEKATLDRNRCNHSRERDLLKL
ncbi:uncharacterized protein HKW66_Vig0238290 [Vigna angularis]|nr:uncharacterized protein HKW66_Vig0238290 [Vigna angularis]